MKRMESVAPDDLKSINKRVQLKERHPAPLGPWYHLTNSTVPIEAGFSVVDPKLFFPDSDPTFQDILDPDPISNPT